MYCTCGSVFSNFRSISDMCFWEWPWTLYLLHESLRCPNLRHTYVVVFAQKNDTQVKLKVSNFEKNFIARRFMAKTHEKQLHGMSQPICPTSSAISRMATRRFFITVFFTHSTLSSIIQMLGCSGWSSSLKSTWSSVDSLDHW